MRNKQYALNNRVHFITRVYGTCNIIVSRPLLYAILAPVSSLIINNFIGHTLLF